MTKQGESGSDGTLASLPDAIDRTRLYTSLEIALQDLGIGLALFEDGEVMYANSTLGDLLGYSTAELKEHGPFALAHPDQREELTERMRARQEGEEVDDRYVVRSRHRDGHRVDIEVSVAQLPGDEMRLLVVMRDVTERQLRERRARHSLKMEAVGKLAGGIAHDFNNYLTAVRLTAETLRTAETDEARDALLDELERVTAGASHLTRQLSTFGGRDLSRPSVLDINIVVFEMSSMLQRLLGDRIELVTQLEPGLPPVCVDDGQLHQIIVNLVVNAQHAMPNGGRVWLETRLVEESGVELAVRDAGDGMTTETKERAFEPFFTTEPGSRSGMGLAIVYGIVKQCGGTIDLQSAEDEGTQVRVVLPATDEVGDRPREPSPVESGPESPSVLLLEDEEKIRSLLVPRLCKLGFEVRAVADGHEALDALDGEQFDVLVADIVVPGPRGVEVARTFRDRQPEGAVVFISGYPEVFEPEEWTTKRVAFLPKPFSAAELGAEIRRLVSS